MTTAIRRRREHRGLSVLPQQYSSTPCGSLVRQICGSSFPPPASTYLPQIKHRMNPRPGSLTIMESPKKVIPGHPKNTKIQCIQIPFLTGLMSAQLMSPSNVCGAGICISTLTNYFPDETPRVDTTLGESPCPLRRMNYTNGSSN